MIEPVDIENRSIDRVINEEARQKIIERQWRSCCFQLEPQSSMFFAKLWISTAIIALCSYQLIVLKECQFQSLYSSILSSVFTYWLSSKK